MDGLQTTRLRKAFADHMPLPATLEPHLRQALGQVLRTPGSLIRPGIVLDVALSYGVPENRATDVAIALEYFHTASLLFDDLPAMDDATERRGMPCVHVALGDASAILAALALVNRAYALTWKAITAGSQERQRRALEYLECQLGVNGLLNGQSMDLHYASLPHDQQTTEKTALGKTVSLVRLTLVLPALIGDAPERELQLLERLAVSWGLSYQIVDDLKDVLQDSAKSGKTTSRDLMLNRPNLALVSGIERAGARLQRLLLLGDQVLERLIVLRPGISFLQNLRAELGAEAAQLIQSACTPAFGGAR